jgi:hypothetical protein
VRTFDDALNNTSIIMLIRSGSRSMLLSGDAQIENWSHSLGMIATKSKAGRDLRRTVANVDVYKVGHHGSRNATPKTLFELWDPVGSRRSNRPPLVTLMSTLPGKHGHTDATAVPKQNLIDAFNAKTTLYRTDALKPDQPVIELHADITGRTGFVPT